MDEKEKAVIVVALKNNAEAMQKLRKLKQSDIDDRVWDVVDDVFRLLSYNAEDLNKLIEGNTTPTNRSME
jgi:hypothetical protein